MRVFTSVFAAIIAVIGVTQPLVVGAVTTHPDVKLLQSHPLPGIPGENMTSVLVTFPPRFKDAFHHHVGSVYVYVLFGTMKTAFGSAPPVVLHEGQSFFEPAGMRHRVAENPSSTQPLRLLVTTVAPPNAPPATYEAMHMH